LAGTNTYGGATAVSAGTLLVDGTTGSAVTVSSGATLGGHGTVGAVSVNGTLAPGDSPGVLNTGNLTLSSGASFNAEIGGTTPGNGNSNYDQVGVTGTVNLGSATLDLSSFNSFSPGAGDEYVLISNDGSDAVSGTFSGLAEGAVVSTDFLGSGRTAAITYKGGDGNDVAIVVAGGVSYSGAGQLKLQLDGTGTNLQFLVNGTRGGLAPPSQRRQRVDHRGQQLWRTL